MNLLKKGNTRSKKKVVFLIIFIFLILVFFTLNFLAGQKVYQLSLKAKTKLENGQKALSERNFSLAIENFHLANKYFSQTKRTFWILKIWQITPFLGRQVKAVNKIIVVGVNLSSALEKISSIGEKISFLNNPDLSFNQITSTQKEEILKTLVNSKPLLFDVKVNIDLAAEAIEEIPSKGVITKITKQVQPIKEKLLPIRDFIDQTIPTLDALVAIAGYPKEKNYLFLLQNENELRPTGGFIGTYGVLTVEAGEIVNLWTDNIYNLDAPFEDKAPDQAPWPIAKYAQPHDGGWFMRDSNWSPDFPTSAEKALWFYQQESPTGGNFDGVIAIDTSFISSLIKLTGNITVDNIEFTPENFARKLQFEVEFNYYRKGIDDADRKEIIGDLAKVLQTRILNLPQNRWLELWQIIEQNADQRHLQIYFKDPKLQNLILEQKWSGKVIDYNNDYLIVVDANLASFKTDGVMSKQINYQLIQTNDDLQAKVSITYTNNGSFTGTTTRYRTYTRVYVSLGSELIEGSGAMENDRTNRPGDYETGTELNKTYFGAFIAIEPKQTKTLSFTYHLPKTIEDQINDGRYKLYIQKQAGTEGHELQVELNFQSLIKYINYYDQSSQITKTNNASWQLDLSQDRELIVDLK